MRGLVWGRESTLLKLAAEKAWVEFRSWGHGFEPVYATGFIAWFEVTRKAGRTPREMQ